MWNTSISPVAAVENFAGPMNACIMMRLPSICTSGSILGFSMKTVKNAIGTDTIFFVERNGLNEARILDNTGYLKSQYVIRVKSIEKDL